MRLKFIGRVLGELLAAYQNDLAHDALDQRALRAIAHISTAYRNFTTGGLQGFSEDFSRGYRLEQESIRRMEEADRLEYEAEKRAITSDDEPNLG